VAARVNRSFFAVLVVCLIGLVAAPASGAFTGTPDALRLVRQMRAAYRKVRAVHDALTGDVVYCPSVPEGWTYAPQTGCTVRARVSEEDDLVKGRVIRVFGSVRSRSRPTLRYVASAQGWFQAAVGAACWTSFGLPFVAGFFVSYPFPGERLAISRKSKREIVLAATTSRFGYRELDYVNLRTHLQSRNVLFTHTRHKTYRVGIAISSLPQPSAAVATPACANHP
jgi:hypothetical protein